MDTLGYKAVISDIDGTLIAFGENRPHPSVLAELRRLQGKGVTVIVATGRGPHHLQPGFLGDIVPDYTISFNGTYIVDKHGTALFNSPMTPEQFDIIEALGRDGHAVGYSFDDGYYLYHHPEKLVTLSGATVKQSGDLEFNYDNQRHLRNMPYVSFCNYPDEKADQFNRENPSLRLAYHRPNTYDLCQSAHNKATAGAFLLRRLGLSWQDVLAIGDGGNDLELIEAAGMGVAMGNAPDFLKQAAKHITGPVQNDGAAAALRHFFP